MSPHQSADLVLTIENVLTIGELSPDAEEKIHSASTTRPLKAEEIYLMNKLASFIAEGRVLVSPERRH